MVHQERTNQASVSALDTIFENPDIIFAFSNSFIDRLAYGVTFCFKEHLFFRFRRRVRRIKYFTSCNKRRLMSAKARMRGFALDSAWQILLFSRLGTFMLSKHLENCFTWYFKSSSQLPFVWNHSDATLWISRTKNVESRGKGAFFVPIFTPKLIWIFP